MPLIVMTGVPSSGKTKRALELKEYFEKQGREVHLISEYEEIVKAGFEKNAFYKGMCNSCCKCISCIFFNLCILRLCILRLCILCLFIL